MTSKRPHSATEEDGDISDSDPRLQHITDSCDVVRRKIHNFINSGGMKVGEFQNAIGVSGNSYSRFMSQKGPHKGDGCDAYQEAFIFFKKRELQGIKEPKKRVKKEDQDKKLDVSGVHLDGEENGAVEIYDTCDEVRRKLAAHLRESSVSQAAFLRALSGMVPQEKKFTAGQLRSFQSKKGPLAGSSAEIYYAAYVFFEKLRVKEGKDKSKLRKGTEEAWARDGGIPREGEPSFWCRDGEAPVQDKYGRVSFQRGSR